MYLRCLLCFELPDQVALLSNTSVGTRAGVCLSSCCSTGGRSHARFVVQTRFLLKLGLQKEKKGEKGFIIHQRLKTKSLADVGADAGADDGAGVGVGAAGWKRQYGPTLAKNLVIDLSDGSRQ